MSPKDFDRFHARVAVHYRHKVSTNHPDANYVATLTRVMSKCKQNRVWNTVTTSGKYDAVAKRPPFIIGYTAAELAACKTQDIQTKIEALSSNVAISVENRSRIMCELMIRHPHHFKVAMKYLEDNAKITESTNPLVNNEAQQGEDDIYTMEPEKSKLNTPLNASGELFKETMRRIANDRGYHVLYDDVYRSPRYRGWGRKQGVVSSGKHDASTQRGDITTLQKLPSLKEYDTVNKMLNETSVQNFKRLAIGLGTDWIIDMANENQLSVAVLKRLLDKGVSSRRFMNRAALSGSLGPLKWGMSDINRLVTDVTKRLVQKAVPTNETEKETHFKLIKTMVEHQPHLDGPTMVDSLMQGGVAPMLAALFLTTIGPLLLLFGFNRARELYQTKILQPLTLPYFNQSNAVKDALLSHVYNDMPIKNLRPFLTHLIKENSQNTALTVLAGVDVKKHIQMLDELNLQQEKSNNTIHSNLKPTIMLKTAIAISDQDHTPPLDDHQIHLMAMLLSVKSPGKSVKSPGKSVKSPGNVYGEAPLTLNASWVVKQLQKTPPPTHVIQALNKAIEKDYVDDTDLYSVVKQLGKEGLKQLGKEGLKQLINKFKQGQDSSGNKLMLKTEISTSVSNVALSDDMTQLLPKLMGAVAKQVSNQKANDWLQVVFNALDSQSSTTTDISPQIKALKETIIHTMKA
ncbi:MAG: hypothetical protein ACO3K7_07015, partial [Candidatus Marinamargulisbacteria bacterium]